MSFRALAHTQESELHDEITDLRPPLASDDLVPNHVASALRSESHLSDSVVERQWNIQASRRSQGYDILFIEASRPPCASPDVPVLSLVFRIASPDSR